jgi:hypothetical protein
MRNQPLLQVCIDLQRSPTLSCTSAYQYDLRRFVNPHQNCICGRNANSIGLLLRTGRVNSQHPDWSRLNRYFVWDPTPAQDQQTRALLRDLRSRERAARVCGVTNVWDAAVELVLRQSRQEGHDRPTETVECTLSSGHTDADSVPPFGVNLSQPFDFDWVDHDFTNYCGAESFIGRLDYILPDSAMLRVARVAPMPQFAQAAMGIGWPCVGRKYSLKLPTP